MKLDATVVAITHKKDGWQAELAIDAYFFAGSIFVRGEHRSDGSLKNGELGEMSINDKFLIKIESIDNG